MVDYNTQSAEVFAKRGPAWFAHFLAHEAIHIILEQFVFFKHFSRGAVGEAIANKVCDLLAPALGDEALVQFSSRVVANEPSNRRHWGQGQELLYQMYGFGWLDPRTALEIRKIREERARLVGETRQGEGGVLSYPDYDDPSPSPASKEDTAAAFRARIDGSKILGDTAKKQIRRRLPEEAWKLLVAIPLHSKDFSDRTYRILKKYGLDPKVKERIVSILNEFLKERDSAAKTSQRTAVSGPTDQTAHPGEGKDVRRLAAQITDKVRVYGIGQLIEKGEFVWDDRGLAMVGAGAGKNWCECGMASEIVGDLMVQSGIGGTIEGFTILRKVHLAPVTQSGAADEVKIVDSPLSHAVVVTGDGYVIDATPWNRILQDGILRSRLEDHPMRSALEASMRDSRMSGVTTSVRRFPTENVAIHYPYLVFEDEDQAIGTLDLPVALKSLGGNRFLDSSIGIGFRRGADGALNFVFRCIAEYGIFDRTTGIVDIPQSFLAGLIIPVDELFKRQAEIKRLLDRGDADEAIRFISAQPGAYVVLNNDIEGLNGNPDRLTEAVRLARDNFHLLLALMSKIPPISEQELSERIAAYSGEHIPHTQPSDSRLRAAIEDEIHYVFKSPQELDSATLRDWEVKDRVVDGDGVYRPEVSFERGCETVRLMDIRKGDTLLDIGIGPFGGLSLISALYGARVTAVENNPEAIAAIKKRYEKLRTLIESAGGSFELIEGDFADAGVQDRLAGKFKHVIATDAVTPRRIAAQLAARAPPTWEPNKVQRIIDGVSKAKNSEAGVLLFSSPEWMYVVDPNTGRKTYTDQVPYLMQAIKNVVNAGRVIPQSATFVSVPFSWGLKRGVLYKLVPNTQPSEPPEPSAQKSLSAGSINEILNSELRGFDPGLARSIRERSGSQEWPSEQALIAFIRDEYDKWKKTSKPEPDSASSEKRTDKTAAEDDLRERLDFTLREESHIRKALEHGFPFNEYVRMALYDPDFGYYSSGEVELGVDFGTFAIALSPAYGEMIAEHSFRIWQEMVRCGDMYNQELFHIVEGGAGIGVTARDILRHISNKAKTEAVWKMFYDNVRYVICELSPKLAERQMRTLKAFGKKAEVRNVDAVDMGKAFKQRSIKGLIFSDELLDAHESYMVRFNRDGGVDCGIAVMSLNKDMLQVMSEKQNIDVLAELEKKGVIKYSELAAEDASVKTGIGREDDIRIYISKDRFLAIKRALAHPGLEKLEWAFNRCIEGTITLVPAEYVIDGKLRDYINTHIDEIAIGVSRADSDVELNLMPDNDDFIRNVSGVLGKGYLLTMDLGVTASELFSNGGGNLSTYGMEWNQPYVLGYTGEIDICAAPIYTMIARTGGQVGLETVFYGTKKDLEDVVPVKITTGENDLRIERAFIRMAAATNLDDRRFCEPSMPKELRGRFKEMVYQILDGKLTEKEISRDLVAHAQGMVGLSQDLILKRSAAGLVAACRRNAREVLPWWKEKLTEHKVLLQKTAKTSSNYRLSGKSQEPLFVDVSGLSEDDKTKYLAIKERILIAIGIKNSLVQSVQPASPQDKKYPPGSPVGLFDLLVKADRLMTVAEIEEALQLERSTLKADINAFMLHLRGILEVRTINSMPAYSLSAAAYTNRVAVRAILAGLQDVHGYRPRVSALEFVQRPIEQALKEGSKMMAQQGRSIAREGAVASSKPVATQQLDLFGVQSEASSPVIQAVDAANRVSPDRMAPETAANMPSTVTREIDVSFVQARVLQDIQGVLKRINIHGLEILLFGSYADGRENPNDLDLISMVSLEVSLEEGRLIIQNIDIIEEQIRGFMKEKDYGDIQFHDLNPATRENYFRLWKTREFFVRNSFLWFVSADSLQGYRWPGDKIETPEERAIPAQGGSAGTVSVVDASNGAPPNDTPRDIAPIVLDGASYSVEEAGRRMSEKYVGDDHKRFTARVDAGRINIGTFVSGGSHRAILKPKYDEPRAMRGMVAENGIFFVPFEYFAGGEYYELDSRPDLTDYRDDLILVARAFIGMGFNLALRLYPDMRLAMEKMGFKGDVPLALGALADMPVTKSVDSQLKPSEISAAPAEKKYPRGSPVGLFDLLVKADRFMTVAEIEKALQLERLTLQADINAFTLHLGGILEVKTINSMPAYALSAAAYANRVAVRAILAGLQDVHGYRPRVSALESVQRPIEQALKESSRMMAQQAQSMARGGAVASPKPVATQQLDLFGVQSEASSPVIQAVDAGDGGSPDRMAPETGVAPNGPPPASAAPRSFDVDKLRAIVEVKDATSLTIEQMEWMLSFPEKIACRRYPTLTYFKSYEVQIKDTPFSFLFIFYTHEIREGGLSEVFKMITAENGDSIRIGKKFYYRWYTPLEHEPIKRIQNLIERLLPEEEIIGRGAVLKGYTLQPPLAPPAVPADFNPGVKILSLATMGPTMGPFQKVPDLEAAPRKTNPMTTKSEAVATPELSNSSVATPTAETAPDNSAAAAADGETRLLASIEQVKIFRANEENARLARIWSLDTERNLNKALESLRKGDAQKALWWFDAELRETQAMIDRAEDENKRGSFERLKGLVYDCKQQILGQRGDDPKSATPVAAPAKPGPAEMAKERSEFSPESGSGETNGVAPNGPSPDRMTREEPESGDLVIEAAVAEDADAIGELWQEHYMPDRKNGYRPATRTEFDVNVLPFITDIDDSDKGKVFVARLGGRIIGYIFVMVYPMLQEGRIIQRAVHKEYRERGIGQALASHAVQWLKNVPEVQRIYTWDDSRGNSTTRTYRKLGFELTGNEQLTLEFYSGASPSLIPAPTPNMSAPDEEKVRTRSVAALGREPAPEEFAVIWRSHLTRAPNETGSIGKPDAYGIYRHGTLLGETKQMKSRVLAESGLFSKDQIERLFDYGACGKEEKPVPQADTNALPTAEDMRSVKNAASPQPGNSNQVRSDDDSRMSPDKMSAETPTAAAEKVTGPGSDSEPSLEGLEGKIVQGEIPVHVGFTPQKYHEQILKLGEKLHLPARRQERIARLLKMAEDARSRIMVYAVFNQVGTESLLIGCVIVNLRKTGDVRVEALITDSGNQDRVVKEALVKYLVNYKTSPKNRDRIVLMASEGDIPLLSYLYDCGFRATGKIIPGYFAKKVSAYEMVFSIWEDTSIQTRAQIGAIPQGGALGVLETGATPQGDALATHPAVPAEPAKVSEIDPSLRSTLIFLYELFHRLDSTSKGPHERLDLLKEFGDEGLLRKHFANMRRVVEEVKKFMETPDAKNRLNEMRLSTFEKVRTCLSCAETNLINAVLNERDYMNDLEHIEDFLIVARVYMGLKGINLLSLSQAAPVQEASIRDAVEAARNIAGDKLPQVAEIAEMESARSLIVYADSILEQGAVVDLEDTMKRAAVLNGGTVVLYGINAGRLAILEKMIRDANSSVEVVWARPSDLVDGTVSNDMIDLRRLINLTKSRYAKNKTLLGVIKGPTLDVFDGQLKDISEANKIAVVSFESDNGIYSFYKALAAVVAGSRDHNWTIILPPVKAIGEDLQKAYEKYLRLISELETKA
jgi:SAM-dependent MidA family methyltransferase/GNAT superfamily N-acetyltransferase